MCGPIKEYAVAACEVRTKEELWKCDGLIIPGGESTTMALIAQATGMWSELQRWVDARRPVYGTCAGLILLADMIESSSASGCERARVSLHALDVTVRRNAFGSQIASFEHSLRVCDDVRACAASPSEAVWGVFIRAPAIVAAGARVEQLAFVSHVLPPAAAAAAAGDAGAATRHMSDDAASSEVLVGVRCGFVMGTAFHPELTRTYTWHAYFARLTLAHALSASSDPSTWAGTGGAAAGAAATAAAVPSSA